MMTDPERYTPGPASGWHNSDRRYIAVGAAGWHIRRDVRDRHLGGTPIGRIVAGDAMKSDGWQKLNAEYAAQFDIEGRLH